ncbi:MAG: ester cyclase [Candidatus Tectomicrobia bacterium]|nr:ester cyclase [Candidatus Tectomicrobia bacterium]
MSQENKAIVRRAIEEVWNKRNPAAIDEIYAANYVIHNPPGGISPNREGLKQWVSMVLAAFPDTHWTVEDQIAEGDKVVTRLTIRSTHTGEFMNIPSTGKQVVVTAITISRIERGKIQEGWANWDALGMMQQLGTVSR